MKTNAGCKTYSNSAGNTLRIIYEFNVSGKNVATFKSLLNIDTHAMVVKPSPRQTAILQEKIQEVVHDPSYEEADRIAMEDIIQQLERQ